MKLVSILSLAAVSAFSLANVSRAVVTTSDGDLILGFIDDSATSVEVNLGKFTDFVNASGAPLNLAAPIDLSSKLSWLDVTSTFADLSTVTWSVVGTNKNTQVFGGITLPKNTLFLTSARDGTDLSTLAVQTAAYDPVSAAGLAAPAVSISNLYKSTLGGLNGAASTANSSVTAVIASGANSFKASEGGGAFQTGFPIANSAVVAPGSYQISDLYEMTPNAVAYLGSFVLSDLGSLSFVTDVAGFLSPGVVIPEPSTYAAFLGAAVLGFSALRRRKVATA